MLRKLFMQKIRKEIRCHFVKKVHKQKNIDIKTICENKSRIILKAITNIFFFYKKQLTLQ